MCHSLFRAWRGRVRIAEYAWLFFSFYYLTGGGHRKSDQDQRERPMGGWMQRQTRPLSFHPRSVVGTVLSRRRELRSAGSRHLQHIPSLSVSSCWNRRRFLQAHTIWNSELNWSVFPAHPNMWCVGWSCLMSFWWTPVILRGSPCGWTDIGLPALWNITAGLPFICRHTEVHGSMYWFIQDDTGRSVNGLTRKAFI